MSQASSRMVSLYRLTGAADLRDCLIDPHGDVEVSDHAFERDGYRCLLRFGYLASPRPSWQAHVETLVGERISLPGVDPFAVLLVDRQPWVYALTWGAGHALLDDEFVEQGFGLSFGIGRLDEYRLGSVTSHALDTSSRIAQISFPRGADLARFGIRQHGELITSVRGGADLSDLACGRNSSRTNRTIVAADKLQVPLGYEFTDLIGDLDVIAGVVDRSAPENALRAIAQVRRLRRNHALSGELADRLARAVDDGGLDLGWPLDTADYGAAQSFRIRSFGTPIHVSELSLDDLSERLRGIPVEQRVAALRKARVQAYADEEGTEPLGGGSNLGKWLAFETVLDDNRYVLRGGEWIRIGEAYVAQIRDEVEQLFEHRADFTMPKWRPTGLQDDENRYCKQVESETDMLCFDRSFARTQRHQNIELCDLYGPHGELIHVKWLGGAPAFSHLLSQADASMTALQNEPEAYRWLREELGRRTRGQRTVERVPDTIVLAAAGRRWHTDELFAMSQISLLSFFHGLPRNVRLQFVDIPFTPKRRRR